MDVISVGLMEWTKWTQGEKLGARAMALLSFHTYTVTLLSLILPLSFLLLARLSTAQHLLSFTPHPTPSSIILSLFLETTPPLMHTLVLSISVAALVCTVAGREPRARSCLSWALLLVLQLGVVLGIEATMAYEVRPVEIGDDGCIAWGRRALFLVGLHGTMLFWSRAVVRSVVDDTVYGFETQELAVERVVTGVAFGALWWWKLKNEVEGLAVLVGGKREVVDFVGWMVYYITVVVGLVISIKGSVWMFKFLLCREPKERSTSSLCEEDDKV